MEDFAAALNYAIPGFISLILIEIAYGWWTGDIKANSMDTISSLSSGVTNITKSIMGLGVA
ncbi:MAG: sterol desaturase, partial [Ekhidna sp.]|nr:sterol desaturase [Ekhidna sp.]